jgi:hypothetical protein
VSGPAPVAEACWRYSVPVMTARPGSPSSTTGRRHDNKRATRLLAISTSTRTGCKPPLPSKWGYLATVTQLGDRVSRAQARIAESLGEMRALADEITAWHSRWDDFDTLGAHHTQLDTLADVALDLVAAIIAATQAIDPGSATEVVYFACRREDQRLLHVRRLWRWYADKLDQRAGPPGDPAVKALRAADELIWSCWKTAFQWLGTEPPGSPVPYLAPQFSAFATPRTAPPPDLRPGRDDLLIRHIQRLPLPVIGLPPICQRRPWWLVIAVHEASHHVQFEAGLEDATQDAVVGVAGEEWRLWCRELFADACAVLLAGPAAIWAITELEAANAPGKSPSASYPPPEIRLAVAYRVAEKVRFPIISERPRSPHPTEPHIANLMGCVPGVADALLNLRLQGGKALGTLAETTTEAYRNGTIKAWQEALRASDVPFPVTTLEAARLCTAGSIAAWQEIADMGQPAIGHLASQVLSVLPYCAEPGRRAAGAGVDARTLAAGLAADLYAEDPDNAGSGSYDSPR